MLLIKLSKMKRRNFFKLTGYGGVGLTAVIYGDRSLANVSQSNSADLPTYDFATVKVDRQGKEKTRSYHRASLHAENLGNYQTLAMVLIPAGKFDMGASVEERASSDRERPRHQVKVSSFLMGKYPITQAQWRTVAKLSSIKRELKSDPSHFKGNNRPVECVSWLDAVEFCDRLSVATGKQYRLPSEAEWEYACRGNSKGDSNSPFTYGATLTDKLADYASGYVYASEKSISYRSQTTDVGSFVPNAFGLYDLHGNVAEWCADSWHENYQSAPNNSKVWQKGGNQKWRVLRGGSWANKPSYCRSAHRSGYLAKSLNRTIGFRIAMDL